MKKSCLCPCFLFEFLIPFLNLAQAVEVRGIEGVCRVKMDYAGVSGAGVLEDYHFLITSIHRNHF